MTLTELDKQDLTSRYKKQIEEALELRADQEQNWLKWLRLYHAQPKNAIKSYPWKDASNLVVGLAATYCDVYIAKVLGTIFAVRPHWSVTQLNSEFAPHTKPLERYMDWARQAMWRQKNVVKTAVQEASKLGTSFIFNAWRDEPYLAPPGAPPRGAGGEGGAGEEEPQAKLAPLVEAARFRGPAPLWIPREDVLTPHGVTDHQSSPWVAIRLWFTQPDLERLEFSGFLQDTETVVGGSPDELPQLREHRASSNPSIEADSPYRAVWSVWFTRDVDNDGYPEHYVMMLHLGTATMLRFRPVPYMWGMRPLVKIVFVEVEGKFDGMGVPEMVEHFQEEVSTIHNQRRDNSHLGNTTMIKARSGSGIRQNEDIYPGRVWVLTDTNDLQGFQLGTTAQSTVLEEQLTLTLAERRVGISDLGQGRESSPTGRAAATTVLSLMGEATKRWDFITSGVRDALSQQGEQLLELWRVHGLPGPGEPYSPEQVLDPQDATLVRELMAAPPPIPMHVELNVSTAALNREIEKQSTLQLAAVFENYEERLLALVPQLLDPKIPPAIKELLVRVAETKDELMRRILTAHEVYDMEDLLIGDQLRALAMPAPAMLQGGNGLGGGLEGAGGAAEEAPGGAPEPSALL